MQQLPEMLGNVAVQASLLMNLRKNRIHLSSGEGSYCSLGVGSRARTRFLFVDLLSLL